MRMGMVEVNINRRRLVTRLITGMSVVGAGFAVVPFLSSMSPRARAKAAGAPTTVARRLHDNPGV